MAYTFILQEPMGFRQRTPSMICVEDDQGALMTSPTPINNEDRARLVRQLSQHCIQLALQSRWEEAVSANRELLKLVQRNPETLNRLGKAYSELGRYAEAKKAYGESLQIDANNNIARKNL